MLINILKNINYLLINIIQKLYKKRRGKSLVHTSDLVLSLLTFLLSRRKQTYKNPPKNKGSTQIRHKIIVFLNS